MHVLIPAVSRFTQLTGICRYAVNHAKAVADVGYISRVTLVVGDWQVAYFGNALHNSGQKIEVIAAQCRKDPISRNLWYEWQLPRVSARLGADLVHLSYPVPIRRRRFKVPLMVTLHDFYPMDHPENFEFPGVLLNRAFLKRCIREADAIVCVSQETRERLKHYYNELGARKTVATISSYSDLNVCRDAAPANFPFNRYILSVGQHRKNKNHDLLIRAYHELASSGAIEPGIGLVIAGAPGPETPALRLWVRTAGLSERVTFLHSVSDSTLAWLYRNCELFVAASSIEGFCLPLIEALQLSRRVLCSDIGIFREVSNEECEFFSFHQSPLDHLVAAIKVALSNTESAPRTVDARFSRQATRSAYEQLYRRITEKVDKGLVSAYSGANPSVVN
jgi:glycosyltransferase involved in cell wall biosynthesis